MPGALHPWCHCKRSFVFISYSLPSLDSLTLLVDKINSTSSPEQFWILHLFLMAKRFTGDEVEINYIYKKYLNLVVNKKEESLSPIKTWFIKKTNFSNLGKICNICWLLKYFCKCSSEKCKRSNLKCYKVEKGVRNYVGNIKVREKRIKKAFMEEVK